MIASNCVFDILAIACLAFSCKKYKSEDLKPFILLVADKGEGLQAAEDLLQKTNANPVLVAGHPDFSEDMLYG